MMACCATENCAILRVCASMQRVVLHSVLVLIIAYEIQKSLGNRDSLERAVRHAAAAMAGFGV